ncbi:MAG: hypothetical protein ACFFD4_19785 [Candidatus Odinarchaeota archaeon]
MNESPTSVKRLKVKTGIIRLLATEEQASRTRIVEECSNQASEPTVYSILKELISEGLVDEFTLPRSKDSNGGRPSKYYKLIVKSEKKDHCEICYRKYRRDSETGKKEPVEFETCVDCKINICSDCTVTSLKGILCIGCANNYYHCPSCQGEELLIPDETGMLVCQEPECGAYLMPRDEKMISDLWKLVLNPNFDPGPRITYTINLIQGEPQETTNSVYSEPELDESPGESLQSVFKCTNCGKEETVILEKSSSSSGDERGMGVEEIILLEGSHTCECGQEWEIVAEGVSYPAGSPVDEWEITDIEGCEEI